MTEQIKYYYSHKAPGLYTSAMQTVIESAGLTASDLIEITEKEYVEVLNPPEGYSAIFDKQGLRLEKNPAPDYVAIAEEQKNKLIDAAREKTYFLNMKLMMGRKLTTAEAEILNSWLDYIDLLNSIKLEGAPDIEWPPTPA